MTDPLVALSAGCTGPPPLMEVVVEVPRWGFVKRGSNGRIDFVSPLPCPFNYGAIPGWIGLDGDLLDAVVLGPRLAVGTRVSVKVWGAVTLVDRGMADDKLVCSAQPVTAAQWRHLLWYFGFYSVCKWWLNRWRGLPGRNACVGWRSATAALARASPPEHGPVPGCKPPP